MDINDTTEEREDDIQKDDIFEERKGIEGVQEDVYIKVLQLEKLLNDLNHKFDQKIAVDEYKNQLFDNLHKELVGYQNDNVDKLLNTICLELIQLVDYVKKVQNRFQNEEMTEDNYKKLRKNVHGIEDQVIDILYQQNIEPYHIEGNDVDVKKQKIIGTETTDSIEKDNTISEFISDGYDKNGKIIRPERVKIYKYKEKMEEK